MTTLPLPAGFMSEQGAEARNKYYRNDRLRHSRKNSRIANMEDVFFRAMDSSDPLVNSKKTMKSEKRNLTEYLEELGFFDRTSEGTTESEITQGDYGIMLDTYDSQGFSDIIDVYEDD